MSMTQCSACGNQFALTPEMLGRKLRCRACGMVFRAEAGPAEAMPTPGQVRERTSSAVADEIDYEVFGDDMQFCEVTLDPGEQVIAEAGAMLYMTAAIGMDTVFGDPSASQQGFWDKITSAGKRALTGESIFMTTFTNQGAQREIVAFGAPYPGKILPLHLDQLGGEIICQKDAFLCGARGIQIDIAFQKRIGVGLFGGEGFIMQRLKGDGIALVHAGGTMMCKELAAGETLKLDTGCLMAQSPSVDYSIEMVGGFKNTFFGGEGLFLATLRGPGKVWVQSLPFSRLAGRIVANAPGGTQSKGEGSILNHLGGLGNMVMGD